MSYKGSTMLSGGIIRSDTTGTYPLVDAAAINITKDNTDRMLDAFMQEESDKIAPQYDASKNYNQDDLVIYNNKLYQCKADKSAAAWDATKWNAVDLTTSLQTERTLRTNQHTTMSNELADEVTNRTNAITTEKSERSAQDTLINSNINTLSGRIATLEKSGSISAITDSELKAARTDVVGVSHTSLSESIQASVAQGGVLVQASEPSTASAAYARLWVDSDSTEETAMPVNSDIADDFSTTKTYAVNDIVWYNNILYKCTTAVTTAGAFSSSNWTQIALANEVSELKDEIIYQLGESQKTYSLSWNNNGYINIYSGAVVTNSNNKYTDFIDLSKDDGTLPESLIFTKPTTTDWVNVAVYDNDNVFVSGISIESVLTSEISVPNGAEKFRISASNSTYSQVVVKTDRGESIKSKVDELYDSVNESELIHLTKSGNDVQVRTNYNDDTDFAIRCSINGSANNAFTFKKFYTMDTGTSYSDITSGTVFKSAEDDITPIWFNDSYRGAGHGDDKGYTITFSSAHGFTESNIGEVWTDSEGYSIVICKIPSDTSILVCVPRDSEESTTYSALYAHAPVSPISKDSTTIEFASTERGQLSPSCNNISVKCYVNNNEVTEDGVYKSNDVKIVESYDIIYIPSMLKYLKDNVGNNTNSSMVSDNITDKYCSVNNVYEFHENGVVTQYQSIIFDRVCNLVYAGFVQSMPIGSILSIPCTTYKNLTSQSSRIDLPVSSWDNSEYPPTRYYQYADWFMKKGMCIGICNTVGDGIPSKRVTKCDNAGFYYTTYKQYPFAVHGDFTTSKGYSVNLATYRCPIIKTDSTRLVVLTYKFNNEIYLLIECHDTYYGSYQLPSYMIGKRIEIVETSGNIDVCDSFIGGNGIKINVTSDGSAILRLS